MMKELHEIQDSTIQTKNLPNNRVGSYTATPDVGSQLNSNISETSGNNHAQLLLKLLSIPPLDSLTAQDTETCSI